VGKHPTQDSGITGQSSTTSSSVDSNTFS